MVICPICQKSRTLFVKPEIVLKFNRIYQEYENNLLPGDGVDVKPSPKVRPIKTFFTKLSKDEYKKELERSTATAVLTVRALVHSPEPPTEVAPAPKKPAGLPAKKPRY